MEPIVWPWALMSVNVYPPVRAYCEHVTEILVLSFRVMPNVVEEGVIGICPSGTMNACFSLLLTNSDKTCELLSGSKSISAGGHLSQEFMVLCLSFLLAHILN